MDLNGPWATDAGVCNKIFVKKGNEISFRQDSDEYGGGVIFDGNRVRGQMQNCTIKSKTDEKQTVHLLVACASGLLLSNVQLSMRIINDNTIVRYFPGMPDNLSIKYARCEM